MNLSKPENVKFYCAFLQNAPFDYILHCTSAPRRNLCKIVIQWVKKNYKVGSWYHALDRRVGGGVNLKISLKLFAWRKSVKISLIFRVKSAMFPSCSVRSVQNHLETVIHQLETFYIYIFSYIYTYAIFIWSMSNAFLTFSL